MSPSVEKQLSQEIMQWSSRHADTATTVNNKKKYRQWESEVQKVISVEMCVCVWISATGVLTLCPHIAPLIFITKHSGL